MELTKYLKEEFDYLPWKTFLTKIRYFSNVISSTPAHQLMQTHLGRLVQNYYLKLGWLENIHIDDWNDRNLRSTLVRFACDRDLPACVNTARTHFTQWMSNQDRDKYFIYAINKFSSKIRQK